VEGLTFVVSFFRDSLCWCTVFEELAASSNAKKPAGWNFRKEFHPVGLLYNRPPPTVVAVHLVCRLAFYHTFFSLERNALPQTAIKLVLGMIAAVV
jgi:hypothetical protein